MGERGLCAGKKKMNECPLLCCAKVAVELLGCS